MQGDSIPENIVKSGTYLLLNEHSKNYAAITERSEGKSVVARTAPEGSLEDVDNSLLWKVTRQSNGRFKMQNIGTALYTSSVWRSGHGDCVRGSREPDSQLWEVKETSRRNTFSIISTHRDLFWGLDDKELNTSVTLFSKQASAHTRWTFVEAPDTSPVEYDDEDEYDDRGWNEDMPGYDAYKDDVPRDSDEDEGDSDDEEGEKGDDSDEDTVPVKDVKARVSGTIAIRNSAGRYLRVTENGDLVFTSTSAGESAIFNVQPLRMGRVALINNDGRAVTDTAGLGSKIIKLGCQYTTLRRKFRVEHLSDGWICLLDVDSGDTFVAAEVRADGSSEYAVLQQQKDLACYFFVENISYACPSGAAMEGSIAIQNYQGIYMRVRKRTWAPDGLVFEGKNVDDETRFVVRHVNDGTFNLIANSGEYVDLKYSESKEIYYCNCSGMSMDSARFQVLYRSPFKVCLTILCNDDSTRYLSWEQSEKGYGMLSVIDEEDETCVFTIWNLD